MVRTSSLLVGAWCLAGATVGSAFVSPPASTAAVRTKDVSVAMAATTSRRDAVTKTFWTTIGAATAVAFTGPGAASAKGPAQEYLTEPTEEFKESEKQRSEFRQAQLKLKFRMQATLNHLVKESKTEKEIEADLIDLKAQVIDIGGMPLGIQKPDLVKQVRSVKARGFWPTSCEYAYQSLINEIAYQQSPNRDKDISNPL